MLTTSSFGATTNAENNMAVRSAKAAGTKPKGLSIRSDSDRNICLKNSGPKSSEVPKKESFLKVQEIRQRALSPPSKSPHTIVRKNVKAGEEFTFKRPLATIQVPKKHARVRDIEGLAGYYDQEKDFNQNLRNVGLDPEFISFFKSRIEVKPYEDDCLSDHEFLEAPPVPSVHFDFADNSEHLGRSPEDLSGPELPSL